MTLVSKSFSEIVTFSRSSNATRVGPTGLVEYAPHNLALNSQDINLWNSPSLVTVTSNATTAPDGTVTADLVVPTAASGHHYVYNTSGAGLTTGVMTTISSYVKDSGLRYVSLARADNSAGITFDLQTVGINTVSGGWSGTITSVGNGWFRITATVTTNANTAAYLWLGPSYSYTGDGIAGMYVWGFQVAVGPYALDYTPTTSAAVYGPRFDYDGSGVTIVEPVSRNLLTYSEQFDNAAWTAVDGLSSTVTANATAAPDGTITADKIVETAVTGFMLIRQTASLVANTAYTVSFYAKAAERSFARILFDTVGFGGSYWYATFNLTNGTVVTNTSATIVPVGNGWYRCSATAATIGTGSYPIYYGPAPSATTGYETYGGVAGSGIFVWGAQLEVGSTATGYMVSGATNGFRAVPVVSGSATPRGLLVEEQRTNLLRYSEDFSNAAWDKGSGFTLTPNAIASPDGTVNADLFVRGTTGIYAYLAQSNSGNASQALTFSCWVRTVSGTSSIRLVISDVNLASLNSSALSINTTWQRLSFSIAAGQLSNTTYIGVGFLMDAGQSAYFWGAQLEAGSFATSYIPTLASTVTRSADVASVNTLSPFYNAVEGTIYAEWSMVGSSVGTGYPSIAQFDDTTATNYIAIRQDGIGDSRRYGIVVTSSTTAQMLAGTAESLSANTVLKSALAYKANDFAFVRGSTLGTASTGSIPAVTNLKLGRNEAGTYINAHVRRIAYYPRRLTNAELQALSA